MTDTNGTHAGLLEGLQARVQRPEYAHTLSRCVAMYCEVRSQLLTPVVQARCKEYAAQPLPSLVRSGCAYLIQVGGGWWVVVSCDDGVA